MKLRRFTMLALLSLGVLATAHADDKTHVDNLNEMLSEHAFTALQLMHPDAVIVGARKPTWFYDSHHAVKSKGAAAVSISVKSSVTMYSKTGGNTKYAMDFFIRLDRTTGQVDSIRQMQANPKPFADPAASAKIFEALGAKYPTLKASAEYKTALRYKDPHAMVVAFLNDRLSNTKRVNVYDALHLETLKSPGLVRPADGFTLEWTLRNTLGQQAIMNDDHLRILKSKLAEGRESYRIGSVQKWVERLGPNTDIPTFPSSIARKGAYYSLGETLVLQPNNVVAADFSRSGTRKIDTTGWPNGRYAIHVEFQDLKGKAIETRSMTFVVTSPVAKKK